MSDFRGKGMRKKRIGLLIVWSSLFLSTVVVAQTAKDSDTLRTHYMRGVAVSAQRPMAQTNDLIPVQSMQGEQLERLSVHSVADAIRYFSGVQIKDYGGIGGLKTVNIRSLGTHHVGVFYDGIELGNAQNGQIDLGRFSLDNMESVSVYNGQRSTILQSAKDFGSAGTVYLQSKVPDFSDGRSYHLRASVKGGSFGTVNPSLLFEKRMSDVSTLAFSGEYLHTTGKYKYRYHTTGGYDTTATRRNGEVESWRLESGFFSKLYGGDWRAKVYLYTSERGLPGAVVRNKLTHEDRQWDTNLFAQTSYRKKVSDAYRYLINVKYAYDFLHYLADPRKDVTLMYVNNKYRQQELYLSTAHALSFGNHWSSSLAVDYQLNHLNADLYNFAYPTRHTLLAAWAAAYSGKHFKAQASVLGSFVFDHVEIDSSSMRNRTEFTPTLVASYRPFEKTDLHVRGFYKRIFRMPTLNDLYYTFIGNTRLRPEYTNQYDIGVTWRGQRKTGALRAWEIQTDGYYNNVHNKIVAVPTSNQFRWTMMNLGRVDIWGLDWSAQTWWTIPGNIELECRLNYTFQSALDHTDSSDAFFGDQIPYVPKHSGSAVLNAAWKMLELNYSFIYTGKRWDQRANIPENKAPEWYTSDVALTYKGQIGKGIAFRLTAEVNNLFNQQFEVVKGYPMPGTNYKLIFTINI